MHINLKHCVAGPFRYELLKGKQGVHISNFAMEGGGRDWRKQVIFKGQEQNYSSSSHKCGEAEDVLPTVDYKGESVPFSSLVYVKLYGYTEPRYRKVRQNCLGVRIVCSGCRTTSMDLNA